MFASSFGRFRASDDGMPTPSERRDGWGASALVCAAIRGLDSSSFGGEGPGDGPLPSGVELSIVVRSECVAGGKRVAQRPPGRLVAPNASDLKGVINYVYRLRISECSSCSVFSARGRLSLLSCLLLADERMALIGIDH